VLFPERDVYAFAQELREAGVRCSYEKIVSSHGHDSFLAEPDKLVEILAEFLREDDPAEDSFRGIGVGERGVGAQDGDAV
jgi:hypothetical protein